MKKRITTCLLVMTVLFALTGCGKSEAVKKVEAMISAIGEVSADSREQINAAAAAYWALPNEEKEKVKNFDQLQNARVAYAEQLIDAITVASETKTAIDAARDAYHRIDDAVKEQVQNFDILLAAEEEWAKQHIAGKWVYSHDDPSDFYYEVEELLNSTPDFDLSEDMYEVNGGSNCWWVDNGRLYVNDGTRIITKSIQMVDGKPDFGAMRQEAYQAVIDDMFKVVTLTPDNFSDYFELVDHVEPEYDAFGEKSGENKNVRLKNTVYEYGFLYWNCVDLLIEVVVPEHKAKINIGRGLSFTVEEEICTIDRNPYSVVCAGSSSEIFEDICAEDITVKTVKGRLVFIRKDYVKEIRQDENGRQRILVLENGENVRSGEWVEGMMY